MVTARRRVPLWPIAQWTLLTCGSILTLVPIVVAFVSSFKSVEDFFNNMFWAETCCTVNGPDLLREMALSLVQGVVAHYNFFNNTFGLPTTWLFSNYVSAWNDASMGRFFVNSIVVTGGGVLLNVVACTPLAYALARYRFRFNGLLYVLLVGGLIAPIQLIGIQLLQWVKALHIFGTYFSLIFPYAAFGVPLAVLVLTGFFGQVPRELDDAGRMDGANEFQVFWLIVLPLIRPALATVVIFNGIGIWNDLFLPLVLAYSANIQTLPLGIILLFGAYSTEWGVVFAAVIIASLPVIVAYFFLTRQFISGLSAGAVKG